MVQLQVEDMVLGVFRFSVMYRIASACLRAREQALSPARVNDVRAHDDAKLRDIGLFRPEHISAHIVEDFYIVVVLFSFQVLIVGSL